MRKEIKEFIQSKKKILILPRNKEIDIISQWKEVRNPLRVYFNFILSKISNILPIKMKRSALRLIGVKIKENVGLAPIRVDSLLPELISIGDNTAIGDGARILCHEFTKDKQRFGKVNIGKNVLIGSETFIRSGVEIGDNSIVSIRSFVNKDIPSNELWGGVPAKRIKKLK